MALQHARQRFASVAQFIATNCDCSLTSPADDDMIEGLLDAASDMVAVITGGMVRGRGQITVRPCRTGDECGCGTCFSCELHGIPLPGANPEVDEVKINGVVIDPAVYSLWNGNYLVRLSATSRPERWPEHQSLWRPDTEDDTFVVTYTAGIDGSVNRVVRQATLELACEYAKDFTGRENAIPRGARTASYQGLSVEMQTAAEVIVEGHENLPMVTRLLAEYASTGRQSAGVWSPDEMDGWTLHTFR